MKKRHPHKSNVLLVNITRLGDMLQATPTIAGLKMENPDCKVTVLVEKQFEAVCHNIPNIDEVLSIDLGMTVRSIAREQEGIIDAYEYLSEVVDDMRARNFDYVLNMSSSSYTALLLGLVGIKNRGGWSSDEEGYRVIESDWAKLFATSVYHQNRQYNSLNLVDVFRCSADVEQHPKKLLIRVEEKEREFAREMIRSAGFTNDGPLVVVQAGASQMKRQWHPNNFIRLIKDLVENKNIRVVLSGTKKELSIIDPIAQGVNSPNVFIAAGRTNIPQLAALLEQSDLLVTGDTGPMHMSVAVETPVIAMFLASAFGYETGPYSEGNIVLQPVIGCGPCNPNKSCARPDCHQQIEPELISKLVSMRLKEDFTALPDGLADPKRVIIYRSYFDKYGFCDLKPLNNPEGDSYVRYREAYRRVWMKELGGFDLKTNGAGGSASRQALAVLNNSAGLVGLEDVVRQAREGKQSIDELKNLIEDNQAPPARLGEVGNNLNFIDRKIEELGYHYPYLGPITRMFIFAKENISGSDARALASQMGEIYHDLERRCFMLAENF